MSALAFSVIASVVLTVVLNVAVRAFPGTTRRLYQRAARSAERSYDERSASPNRANVRVIVPWKAMLIGSVVLTVAINIVLFAFR